MIKKFFTYVKEHKNIVIIFLTLFFILSFSLFFMTYNSKENRTKRYLKNLSKDISSINLTLSKCIKDLTIDTNTSKEVLSNGIDGFNNILKEVSEVEELNQDISSIKTNLSNALNSTIALYNNALIVLSDSKSIRSNDALNNFNTFKENCISDYLKLKDNGINLRFSEDSLKFFDNFYNYLNTLIKINRDSDFNNSQKREFINTLEGFNKDFTYLNEDLTLAINKVREDNRDLNVIIDDLLKKEELFNSIKEKSASISIPEGCMEVYENLNEYLNSYPIYLNAIKEAVIYEKTAVDVEKLSSEINKYYKNAFSKRDDILKVYKSYESKLKNN